MRGPGKQRMVVLSFLDEGDASRAEIEVHMRHIGALSKNSNPGSILTRLVREKEIERVGAEFRRANGELGPKDGSPYDGESTAERWMRRAAEVCVNRILEKL